MASEFFCKAINLAVFGDIARQANGTVKGLGQVSNAFFKPIILVGKCQLRALRMAGFCNTVGNRAVL